jgi:pimeloyl-ACP methyl ester carboxylesterase
MGIENRLDRDCAVRHRRIEVDGCSIFYREAGRDDRPVVLLPHGYPSSLPDAELHLLDGGHWALETNLDEIVALTREFLERVYGNTSSE